MEKQEIKKCCEWGFCTEKKMNLPDCDFKTLPKEKVAILNRISEERVNIEDLFNKIRNLRSFKKAILMRQMVKNSDNPIKTQIMDKMMGILSLYTNGNKLYDIEDKYKGDIVKLAREII